MLARRLAGGRMLLADGAMATALFARGLPRGEAPERWSEARPKQVRAVHRAAVAAGSDLILANSFGANAVRLARWGAADRMAALNRAAAHLARAEAAAGRAVLVAGVLGPTGLAVGPGGPLTTREAAAIFEAQARALVGAGADLLWLETFGALPEFAAAAEGAARTGAPWCGTMSFEADGRTRDGAAPADLAALAAHLPAPPAAIGANCGAGPEAALAALDALRAAGAGGPLIAKANAGLPRVEEDRLAYDVTPAALARYALAARGRGAGIVGGCCGVEAGHLAAMRAALDAARSPGDAAGGGVPPDALPARPPRRTGAGGGQKGADRA